MRKVACFLASVALALSACSSPEEGGGDPETEETTAAQATTEETETQAPEETDEVTPSEDPESAPESAAEDNDRDAQEAEEEGQNGDEECVPPVPGAYPCAGGPRPAGAQPLPAFPNDLPYSSSKHSGLFTPSGNIICTVGIYDDLDEVNDMASCWVKSWVWEEVAPNPVNHGLGSNTELRIEADGATHFYPVSEIPLAAAEAERGRHVTIAEYGSVWYFENFVFASSENGLTFWDTQAGHGALINRAGAQLFQR